MLKPITALCVLACLSVFSWRCGNGNPAPEPGASGQPAARPAETKTLKNIVFFGNSLTAAYGLDPSEGFVSLIQRKVDSLGLPYHCVNAGLSGETTAGGLGRVDWILKQPVSVFVLELGGNDGLRGIRPDASLQNLQGIIDKVKAAYPDARIILAGMQAPPNMGADFTRNFKEMYPKLARSNNLTLIPFILEGVAGDPSLNQADGIHPTAAGNRIVAETIWKVLHNLL